MRKILLTMAAPTLVFVLTACGESEPVTGTVVEKEHTAAVWDTRQKAVYTDFCSGVGSKRTCTKLRTGTRTENVLVKPECYELDLDTGWEGCVNQRAWKALEPGDTYDSTKRY